MSRLLVTFQFVSAASLVVTARLDVHDWASIVVSGSGVMLGLWAILAIGPSRVSVSPDVKLETELVTAGPYRFIRHPMYTALAWFTGGLVTAPFYWWKVAVWALLLIVLFAKSQLEERKLVDRFSEYRDYAQRTWRFVPLIW